MTISTRYAVPLAVVLAFALVPTLIHSYAGLTVDDGRRASELTVRVDGSSGSATKRKADWVERRLSSDDWIERRFIVDGHPVTLFVGRSLDAKALYHHPELALAYGRDLSSRGIVDVSGVPAHALQTETGDAAVVLYALEANGDFVTDPVRYQIRSAATHLVRGRSPMTLFFVVQEGRPESDDLSKTTAARVLKAAVDSFSAAR